MTDIFPILDFQDISSNHKQLSVRMERFGSVIGLRCKTAVCNRHLIQRGIDVR